MDIEEIAKIHNPTLSDDNFLKIIQITKELLSEFNLPNIKNRKDITNMIDKIGRKHKVRPSMIKILNAYRILVSNGEIKFNLFIEQLLRTKNVRSLSGVVVITVFTSPYPETSKGIQEFSCEYNCAYCPKEPNQPRSYLLNEPGVLRANANNFIATNQFFDRAKSYILMGHPLDKIELIVSGGTFSSYPREYIDIFFRDLFFAANTSYDKIAGRFVRPKQSLSDEQLINETTSLVKIIGITVETRPDRINKTELEYFRYLGVTRVQIGVQHLNNAVLEKINRKANNDHTIKAIKALKESGFKVDIHLMPDLPPPDNVSVEEMINLDYKMFEDVINLPEYQADQWKIYPCETVDWTLIKEWYEAGIYKPYGEQIINGKSPLLELLIWTKSKVKPWVRLNRIIRDIPNFYIIAGNKNTSMRSDLLQIMEKRNLKCNCIRCREVGANSINLADYAIIIRKYSASDGIEYFISWENSSSMLLGFCRLRINSSNINKYFPELNNCALIRELHIYGQVIQHSSTNNGIGVQHRGLGKALIAKAIDIASEHNLPKIAVIAGTGVRMYYIKQGFLPLSDPTHHGNYLIMNINNKLENNKSTNVDIKKETISIAHILIIIIFLLVFGSIIFKIYQI